MTTLDEIDLTAGIGISAGVSGASAGASGWPMLRGLLGRKTSLIKKSSKTKESPGKILGDGGANLADFISGHLEAGAQVLRDCEETLRRSLPYWGVKRNPAR